MVGQTLQIPILSPIDTETNPVIQTEPSFARKNSIVYKGVLSNLTKSFGEGILSTTGKHLRVDGKTVYAGDVGFPITSDKVVLNYTSVESFSDILCARYTNSGVWYIRKPSPLSLIVKTDKGSFQIYNDQPEVVDGTSYKPYNITGFIAQNEEEDTGIGTANLIMIAKSFVNGDKYYNKLSIYDDYGTPLYEWDQKVATDWCLFGDIMTGFVKTKEEGSRIYNYIYWGFDDADMRKRVILLTYYFFEKTDADPIYTGNGPDYILSSDVQEESVVEAVSLFQYSQDEYIPSLGQTWGFKPLVYGMGLIDDNGFVTGEPILERSAKGSDPGVRGLKYTTYTTFDNGVLRVEVPQSRKVWKETIHHEGEWVDEEYVDPYDEYIYETEEQTRVQMNEALKANPDGYMTGEQAGRDQWLLTDPTRYVESDDDDIEGYDYNYLISIDLKTDTYNTIPALTMDEFGVHVRFFDFSDPFGQLVGTIKDTDQLFPHYRFFSNVQETRGKYWDYGKGWYCYTLDQLYINKYNKWGVAVWETPLQLVYAKDAGTYYLDAYRGDSTISYIAGTDYPQNSKNERVDEREFQKNGSLLLRLHPIRAQMKEDDGVWYSNHTWTGFADNSSLSAIPHTYSLTDDISIGVYSEVPVALSAYKTLLFTPQDLADNYTFDVKDDGYYITRYSKDSVEAVWIGTGDIKIEKVADYEFRLNVLDDKNLLVEDHNGNFTIERAFYPYIMDSTMENVFDIALPQDSTSPASNGIWNFGAGMNFRLDADTSETSTFLLPAISLSTYVAVDDIDKFNNYALANRHGKLRANLWCFGFGDEVDEFYTFNRASPDVTYKNTAYIDLTGKRADKYDTLYSETSWWAEDVVIYPIGIVSKVVGVDYTTPTVDAGNNYSARFFRNSNKTFLVFNQNDLVYFGDRIFTIMSGNYYFDGQGVYYLGSRDDYSQNIFTAYAIGMKFLANSSAEAYFYSEWDKSLYLYTASNTLQKSQSFADMGSVVDSLYSSSEQALYILFESGKLYVKTQQDSMVIEGVQGTKLQSTAFGCQVLGDGYEMYNPHLWDDITPLHLETEWIGNPMETYRYSYVDLVLYQTNNLPTISSVVSTLYNGEVLEKKETNKVKEWKNHLSRIRLTCPEPDGSAIKIKIDSDEPISIYSISVHIQNRSDTPAAPRSQRY